MPYAHNAGLWLLAASLLLGVAGCTVPNTASTTDLRTTEAPNPVQISLVKMDHTIHFAAGRTAPDAREIASLNGFLTTSDLVNGDPIEIERNAAPADDKRSARLVGALTRQGLEPTVVYSTEVATGEMKLVIERYVAAAPNCPNWSKAPGNDFDNTIHSDFGCSTSSDLAAMVADPHDLVAGRNMGPAVGDAASAGVHRYRAGKVLPVPDDTSAAPVATAAPGSTGQ